MWAPVTREDYNQFKKTGQWVEGSKLEKWMKIAACCNTKASINPEAVSLWYNITYEESESESQWPPSQIRLTQWFLITNYRKSGEPHWGEYSL